MRILIGSITLLLALQACFSYAKVIKKVKHVGHHPKAKRAIDGQRKIVKLPMVLYYNKQKAAEKKRVARSAKPTFSPTTSQTIFDYVGGYNNWNFQFTDKHPIQMDWSKPQPFAKFPDAPNKQDQQTAAPAADQAPYQAAPAQTNAAAPEQAAPPASDYQATQNAFQPQTAYPEQNTANQQQNQQPATATTGTQTNNQITTIKVPNNALERAKQGKDVYVALVDEKQNQTSYSLSSVQNDQQQQKDENPIQSFNNKPVKGPKCPYGECNYKGPNAPQAEDQQQTNPMSLDASQQDASATTNQQQQTQFGNKVYPTKVTELQEDSPKMESELVAPEPGPKAERARYTLHVTPKLKDGVPQTQEILIMPPNAVPGSDVKPLVILKQKVTKPMVENIEIDVPPKGTQYSDEPKVEVIEGNKHESLNVVGGQADLSQAEADLEGSNTQQAQYASPTQTTLAQTTAAAAAPTEAAPVQQPAAQTQETQTAQDAQTQYSQTQTPQTYQDTQTQATQTQAAEPAAQPAAQSAAQPTQSYQDTQAQASQTQYAQPEATKTQAAQTQATQTQVTQTQATQTQATQDQTSQTQASQTQAAQAYAQTQSNAAQAPAPAPAQASAYPAQQDAQQNYTANQCSDDARCVSYTDDMCSQNWLQSNCKRKCKLC